MSEENSIAMKMEYFKMDLTAFATGKGNPSFTDKAYSDIRKLLMNEPKLKSSLPKYILVCRNLSEFWSFIKTEYAHYQERRDYLAETLNPIIDYFENSNDMSNLESDYIEGERIGSGGFGQVFKYHHKLLDMDFAIKFFEPVFPIDSDKDIIRFYQEARILFELNHENIISVYDIGSLNNKPYIRMEYFDGINLNQVLQKYGTLTIPKCTILIINISKAMEYAHQKVVHRDLKPSNIMVAVPNKFRVIDFGLGIYREKQLYSRLTSLDKGVGGSLFTAPELHNDPLLIDKRSDIYSLGAIWYTMLVGRAPSGTRMKENLYLVNGITDEYANMILKCMDDLENRYSSFGELLIDLSVFEGPDNNFI